MHRLTSVVAALALLPACFHVDLAPVPRGASSQTRLAAYSQLHPAAQNHTVEVYASKNGVSVVENDELVLGNGETVTHADDLLPVVQPRSAAARAAARSRDARHYKYASWLIAAGSIMAGMVLVLDGVSNDPQSGMPVDMREEQAGLGVMLVGGLAGALVGMYFGHVEHTERRAAFATYDDGLRAQLALCVDGLNVVPCEQVAGPPQ